jgi:glycosyltransferase involved in cell wall biosynthesis
MINLSVIIPCYNEENSVFDLLNECYKIGVSKPDIEFVLVDNGSTDNTNNNLSSFLKSNQNFKAKIVTVKINIGYGNGIIQGLNNAQGDILSWTHADLQTDINDVVLAYEKFKQDLINNKCIVKGKRVNRNFFDNFFTKSMSLISSFILKKNLDDVNAQPKIFNKYFFKSLKNPPLDFSLDLFLLYFALEKKIIIKNYPVVFKKRLTGEAKGGGTLMGKFRLIKRTLKYILELKNRLK